MIDVQIQQVQNETLKGKNFAHYIVGLRNI